MRWIELEIVVPAPPAETFPWVVEPGLLREWIPQLEELRPRGFLHHGPLVRHGALQFALDVRVHRVVVPELLELDVTWRGAVARLHLEVEPHEAGSTVTWRTGLELPPTLRLAGPSVARELRRIMRRDLELLAVRLGERPDEHGAHADDPGVIPDPGAWTTTGAGEEPEPGTVLPGDVGTSEGRAEPGSAIPSADHATRVAVQEPPPLA